MARTLLVTNDFPPRPGGIQQFVHNLAVRQPAGSIVVYSSTWREAAEFDAEQPFEVVREDTGGDNGWEQVLDSGAALTQAPFQSVTNYPQWKDQIATPAFQQFLAGKTDLPGLQKALTDGWSTVNR